LTAVSVMTWERFVATETARRWVRHTEEVLLGIGDFGTAIRDAETGQRGYLLTGEESYLLPYQEALVS
jgi:CHASE3 domain sensor protein